MKLTNEQAKIMHMALFQKALDIMAPKRKDYSGPDVPFANFYTSEIIGVPAWLGASVRLLDKIQRIRQLAVKGGEGDVKDESLIDTAADALNYIAIVLALVIESLPDDKAESMLAKLQAPWGDGNLSHSYIKWLRVPHDPLDNPAG